MAAIWLGLSCIPSGRRRHRPVSYAGYVKSTARAVLRTADGVCRDVAVEKASAYEAFIHLPRDISPGRCCLYVHNGHGGSHGWSNPLEIEIRGPATWPATVFDVRKYGAAADGNTDDSKAIQKALDAAGKAGGGVVLLPRGTYLIAKTLKMPRKTVLRGETRDRTWIFTPNGIDGYCGKREDGIKLAVAIMGNGEFGLEDLSIQSVYSAAVVLAPEVDMGMPGQWMQRLCFGRDIANDIHIDRCRILQQPNFAHAHRPDYPYMGGKKLADPRELEGTVGHRALRRTK